MRFLILSAQGELNSVAQRIQHEKHDVTFYTPDTAYQDIGTDVRSLYGEIDVGKLLSDTDPDVVIFG